ncbi:MAG: hypothetical protein Greene041619_62 [Candidatus Peregrinibacteria bacterium Greene0416_19]|nr:MAG: hypothetical protein Greene041619_62 [Candidatus Peregrinibacteria bacterium Greene0416_19]
MNIAVDPFLLFYLTLAIIGLAVAIFVHATRGSKHNK